MQTTCIGWRVSRFVGKLWVQKSRFSSGQLRSVHAKKHAGCSWVQGRISCWKKNDLHRLAEALQITGTLKCYQGTVFLVWYWNNSREILACNNNNNGNNFISVFPRSALRFLQYSMWRGISAHSLVNTKNSCLRIDDFWILSSTIVLCISLGRFPLCSIKHI